ncbi:MAG: hypothetical protein R2741_07455 [Methanolobus sp.]
MKSIFFIAVLVFGIVVSGCADKIVPEEETVSNDTVQELSAADEALNEEMIGITDTEIQDLEAELAELEALIDEMELEEDIIVEEI